METQGLPETRRDFKLRDTPCRAGDQGGLAPRGSCWAAGPAGLVAGPAGPAGPTGAAGAPALAAQVEQGADAGPSRVPGRPPGPAGPGGPAGPDGVTGPQGAPGADGAPGPAGPAGPAGAAGATGPAGLARTARTARCDDLPGRLHVPDGGRQRARRQSDAGHLRPVGGDRHGRLRLVGVRGLRSVDGRETPNPSRAASVARLSSASSRRRERYAGSIPAASTFPANRHFPTGTIGGGPSRGRRYRDRRNVGHGSDVGVAGEHVRDLRFPLLCRNAVIAVSRLMHRAMRHVGSLEGAHPPSQGRGRGNRGNGEPC